MSDDHAKHVAAYRAAMEDCPASRAENDVAARHTAAHLALWDRRPVTPAGRMEMAMALLHPVTVEQCPHCGQDMEIEGEPLITPEAALQIITGGEEPT